MASKFKKKQTAVSDAAKLVREQTDRMQMHYAARERQLYLQVSQLIITNGAEVLQQEFGMSVEDSTRWAQLTIAKSREWLNKGRG